LGKSKGENEATLKEIQKGMSDLVRKKDQMLDEAREKYTDVRVGRIVEKVGRDLSNSADELTKVAISSGAGALSQSISDIVRHTLLHEVRSSMDELNSQIISDISMELKGLDDVLSNYTNGDAPWLDRAVQSTETLLHNGIGKLGEWNDSLSGKGGAVYKVVATILGITTSVVAPLVELIIIFLPEILSGLMKKSREQRQLEEVRSSILTRTIPELKSKLRSQLPEIFNQQVRMLIDEISTQFESKIIEQSQIIASQQAEMEARVSEIAEQINVYSLVVEKMNVRTNFLLTA
jgi:hypothetical protein